MESDVVVSENREDRTRGRDRPYEIGFVPLTNGGFVIVDGADYDDLARWRWNGHGDGYARRTTYEGRRGRTVYMHALLAGAIPEGYQVDHLNGRTWDNRRENLRACPQYVNAHNKPRTVRSTTGYKGVYRDPRTGRYRAMISIGGKFRYISTHDTPEEAAEAYARKAVEALGVWSAPRGGIGRPDPNPEP